MRNCLGLAVIVLALAAAVRADWKADIGYTALQARLGAATPDGSGIAVSHIEALYDGNYLPDPADAEFAGKTFTAKSGSGSPSVHATIVGRNYYGLTSSIAPGITTIDAYEANNWIGTGFLRLETLNVPRTETRRVQNHSWIGSVGDDAGDTDALRRTDLVVHRDGVVIAAGVNNGAATAMPRLLASAYNVLAVGLTSGNSSYGPTPIDVAGRVKPDLVVPFNLTSWGTPAVAGAASLLLQTADGNNILPTLGAQEKKTAKALLVRALLMGGATKTECANWRKGFATPSTDGTVPLDYRYGAGELNIDNSHRILAAGEQDASGSSTVGLTGWDYGTAGPAGASLYFFDIPPFQQADGVSVLVAWNRLITVGAGNPVKLTPSLANIDLRLYDASGFVLGGLRDQSVSAIDNVEHIYRTWLPAGRYAIELTSDRSWTYAIAWDVRPVPTARADFDGDGDVDIDDFAHFQSCFNGPNRPPAEPSPPPAGGCLDADFDGDADVDVADFSQFQACFNGPNTRAACP